MKYNLSILFSLTLLLIITPSEALAYRTTEQTAQRLTDVSAIYTITYSFGVDNQDFYLPIATKRGLGLGKSENQVGYSLREDGDNTTDDGETAGLVFSNAEIRGNMYYIPAGQRKTFTLVVMLRTQDESKEADYALQVENLPFTALVDGITYKRSLNKFELSNYQTPEVEMNPNNPSKD